MRGSVWVHSDGGVVIVVVFGVAGETLLHHDADFSRSLLLVGGLRWARAVVRGWEPGLDDRSIRVVSPCTRKQEEGRGGIIICSLFDS